MAFHCQTGDEGQTTQDILHKIKFMYILEPKNGTFEQLPVHDLDQLPF